MAEIVPKDFHLAVEAEVRSALSRRIADADGYAHKRNVGSKDPTTVMTFTKGPVVVTVTIQASWAPEEPEFETK